MDDLGNYLRTFSCSLLFSLSPQVHLATLSSRFFFLLASSSRFFLLSSLSSCHFCLPWPRSRWMRNHRRCNHQPVFPDKEQSTSVLSHCRRGNYQLGSFLSKHFCLQPISIDKKREKRCLSLYFISENMHLLNHKSMQILYKFTLLKSRT